MNENQNHTETEVSETLNTAPEKTDNAEQPVLDKEVSEKRNEGESETPDPSKELLLGKFKSVEDLSKAYEELQKHQGKNSEELGSLRKELANLNGYKDMMTEISDYRTAIESVISRDKEIYNTEEYLQNKVFKEIYSEALMTFGDNLDTDRLVGLLEEYVKDRISLHDKQVAAENETQQALNSISYNKNSKVSFIPPKKSLDEMTDEEFKQSLRKLI